MLILAVATVKFIVMAALWMSVTAIETVPFRNS